MIRLSYLEKDAGKMLSFSNEDIIEINNIIKQFDNLGLIYLENRCFDFSIFVSNILAFKKLREILVKSIRPSRALLDNLNNSLNSTTSYKYNLFIACISYLNQPFNLEDKECLLFHVESYLNSNRMFNSLLDGFFMMMKLDLKGEVKLSSYDLLKKSTTLPRTGWVMKNMKDERNETIAEHMYNMWLIVSLFLDDDSTAYDKARIEKMVLLHDLAETVTGDIPNPKKTSKDDLQEDLIAKAIISKILLDFGKVGLSYLDIWEEWYLEKSYSSKIAHDIDVIQLYDKLFYYAPRHKEIFTKEELTLWTSRKVKTEVGKIILNKILPDNDYFKE